MYISCKSFSNNNNNTNNNSIVITMNFLRYLVTQFFHGLQWNGIDLNKLLYHLFSNNNNNTYNNNNIEYTFLVVPVNPVNAYIIVLYFSLLLRCYYAITPILIYKSPPFYI